VQHLMLGPRVIADLRPVDRLGRCKVKDFLATAMQRGSAILVPKELAKAPIQALSSTNIDDMATK
jgi:hypothetical protein